MTKVLSMLLTDSVLIYGAGDPRPQWARDRYAVWRKLGTEFM